MKGADKLMGHTFKDGAKCPKDFTSMRAFSGQVDVFVDKIPQTGASVPLPMANFKVGCIFSSVCAL